MRIFQDLAAAVFIGSIAILTFVSVLGVWDILGTDVITKSFMTLGLLAFVAVVIIAAGRFVEKAPVDPNLPPPESPVFKALRQITLGVLIVSSVLLALLGVLAIWEVVTEKEIIYRSLGTLGILAFSSFVTVMVCLEREQSPLWKKHAGGFSGLGLFFFFLLLWLLFSIVF